MEKVLYNNFIFKMIGMPTAFVLINADLGSEREIVKELKKIEEVKEAYAIYGTYDVIVKLEADTMDKLKDTVSSKIRGLKSIRSTLTTIVMEE
jgi:DNA-binding Lrp family transcriptional regulator